MKRLMLCGLIAVASLVVATSLPRSHIWPTGGPLGAARLAACKPRRPERRQTNFRSRISRIVRWCFHASRCHALSNGIGLCLRAARPCPARKAAAGSFRAWRFDGLTGKHP